MIATQQMVWKVRLFTSGMLVLLAMTFATLLWVAREQSLPLVVVQIEKNAQEVGNALADQIRRPIDYGFKMEKLVGVEDVFREELQNSSALEFFALRDVNGKILTLVVRDAATLGAIRKVLESADKNDIYRIVTLPIGAPAPVGLLVVGYPVDFINRQMGSVVIDLVFALIIAFVVVREIGLLLWDRNALRPLTVFETLSKLWANGKSAAVGKVRAKLLGLRREIETKQNGTNSAGEMSANRKLLAIRLIVFMVALTEELIRPFFAVFASEVNPISASFSPTMLAGLPVAAFMITLAIFQPVGPMLANRFDLRRCLITTALIAGLLMGATGLVTDGALLSVMRAGTGACYGLMLIFAQLSVIRITDSRNRVRGLVEVSAAIVAAGIVGPAFGGVLSDRFGVALAFATCGGFYFIASLLSCYLPSLNTTNADGHSSGGAVGIKAMLAVLKNSRVATVIFCSAIPSRLTAAALLVVITPLYLSELNQPATVVGRVLLLYFLAYMITAPIAAQLSDKVGLRKPFVLFGCVCSVIACSAVVLPGMPGIALACFSLGFAQAIMGAAQLAIVTEVLQDASSSTAAFDAPSSEQGLATFRFLERMGSIAAPFVAAAAVGVYGLRGSVIVLGAILAAGGIGLFVGLFNYHEQKITKESSDVSFA